MNYEEWLANREERRFQHEDIDYGEVEKFYYDSYDDALMDEYHYPKTEAFERTLMWFQERGLTESMLEDIIAEN